MFGVVVFVVFFFVFVDYLCVPLIIGHLLIPLSNVFEFFVEGVEDFDLRV